MLAILSLAIVQTGRMPVPYKVEAAMPDLAVPAAPSAVHVGGFIGNRIAENEQNRLKEVDLEPLLAGFRHKPGSHPWIGEHIGKWMHAATLAWANTGDPELKKKLDYAAGELVMAQEPDGYLGTYVKEKRFGLFDGADWDVWSHKYCLIGLLTYYRFTGDAKVLDACEKAGDLLIATFGPGKKSILSAGAHMGMAATSVLEPIVLLSRATGESRYLDFAKYIVSAWDEPGGPRILSTLTSGRGVGETANGKAYEMLSNLVGLCELARATGDERYLSPVLHAWDDIVTNQLYITGTASYGEHFHVAHDLPDSTGYSVGETCVTVTWMQLNAQLLRLTGKAKYGDEFERSLYNHLAAAQRPDGREWCYYTSLDGDKPYTAETCCCLSSGPRGMALVPEMSCLVTHSHGFPYATLNLFDSIEGDVAVDGHAAHLLVNSQFPYLGEMTIKVSGDHPFPLGLALRAPAWAVPIQADGLKAYPDADGWVRIAPPTWNTKKGISVTFNIGTHMLADLNSNPGQTALARGPFVLAYDCGLNLNIGSPAKFEFMPDPKEQEVEKEPDMLISAGMQDGDHRVRAIFVPFADAGADGGRYRIWMRAAGSPNPFPEALFADASEQRSAEGNVPGSISDLDPNTFVVSYDGKRQDSAWFSVRNSSPVTIKRVVFVHGRTFHDGGWFDCSLEKPRIEVQTAPSGPWQLIGHLDTYPAATASSPTGLKGGETFSLVLNKPVAAYALRIIGKPACGDRPEQSFASCAELQAFAK